MRLGSIVSYRGELGKLTTNSDHAVVFVPAGHKKDPCLIFVPVQEHGVKPTTHEEKLEYLRKDFILGEVLQLHCIGDIVIIEYKDCRVGIRYRVYLDYTDTGESVEGLDRSMIVALALKHDGRQTTAPAYIFKMLSL